MKAGGTLTAKRWNYSASGCGKPTVEGTRWCADHIDEWTMLRHSTGDNDRLFPLGF